MNKPPSLWDAVMDELPRRKHERTWGGFAGAVAGAAMISPFLAAGAVARELLNVPPTNDTSVLLARLAGDSNGLYIEGNRIAAGLNFPTASEFSDLVIGDLVQKLRANNKSPPAYPFFVAFIDIAQSLYELPEMARAFST